MKSKSEFALITGASAGFGAEMADILAEKKFNLILTARRADKLEKLKNELEKKYEINAHVITMDISGIGSANKLYDEVDKLGVTVSVLVNNAGYGKTGSFADLDPEVDTNMLMLNIITLTELTKKFIPGMLERKRGWILNVASTGAFQPGPYMSTYFASKSYVLSFTEALWQELKGTGVSATTLCPGPTDTGFMERSELGGSIVTKGIFLYKSPRKVAVKGIDAMFSGRRTIVVGVVNNILLWVGKIIPRRLTLFITARLVG
jgi:short-subunit dehydrogenase